MSAGLLWAGPIDSPRRVAYESPDSPGYSLSPLIRADRIVVKLTADAAEVAAELPVDRLPVGLAPLDRMLEEHEIVDGKRVVGDHGLPIADRREFDRVGLNRWYELIVADPLPESAVWRLVREFAAEPWVEYAEPVYIAVPTVVPDDAEFGEQWSHVNTGSNPTGVSGTPDADADTDLAWDTQTGSASMVVAILDTGADLDHPDLVDNLVPGFDFANNDPDPEDSNGHGTGASGIAAARGNNAIGVAGVCWTCGIMPLLIASSVDETNAITFAADNGATVYSMSHTFGAAWIRSIIDATEYASSQGLLAFASSTNFNGYNIGTPACYPEVISVGGSNWDDVRVYAYNDLSELTAPGPSTRSTALGGGYWYFGGTSSSSPFAAGLAALLRSEDPGLHHRELRHLLRVSGDDEVGNPTEDTPGWDKFMGYGRVNAHTAMQMIDGPWISLDRPHYVCAGDLTVAVKDTSAGSSIQATLTGDIGSDSETVLLTPVSGANGYYEGLISLSWAGVDGPVAVGDGKLDIDHGETIGVVAGSLSTSAFLECSKKVCQWEGQALAVGGDCDNDLALDPGELWTVSTAVVNLQTEEFFDVAATLSTTNPDVVILKDSAEYGSVTPFNGGHADTAGSFRVQLVPGAAANQVVDFNVAFSGRGFTADQQRCLGEEGLSDTFSLRTNRDLGTEVQSWNFDAGNSQQFKSEPSHGTPGSPTGNLSECDGTWTNEWNGSPTTDRSHSGMYSMRLGDGLSYPASVDAGLKSPLISVPGSGGAISFYLWMDSFIDDGSRAWDGMVVEAKRTADPTWTYIGDATYDSKQIQSVCTSGTTLVPFGYAEKAALYSGDGLGTEVLGDTFDVRHQADLSQFAGEQVQVRWRFGSHDFTDPTTHGTGVWFDTVALHDAWVADAWPGAAPQNLLGDETGCPASFALSWDPVAGAGGYEIYRSGLSCADASSSLTPLATTGAATYTDTTAIGGTGYFYAVAATEAGSGCPTVRGCIQGGCLSCGAPPDPTGLLLDRVDNDVRLSWQGSGTGGATWNVYRDPARDPMGWGSPLAPGVIDEDGGTPGIQYTDVDGVLAGTIQHYLVTETTCAESPLR